MAAAVGVIRIQEDAFKTSKFPTFSSYDIKLNCGGGKRRITFWRSMIL